MACSDHPPWPALADGTGHSLVLAYPSYGENDPRAWKASERTGSSPGRGEALLADPALSVVINEFLAQPSPGGDSTATFTFPVGAILPPGGHLLVWADDDPQTQPPDPLGDFHALFKLGDSETITLKRPDGVVVESVSTGLLGTDQSGGHVGDGGGVVTTLSKPTPRRPNPNS